MKKIRNFYRKILSHRSDQVTRIIHSEIILNNIKQSALNSTESLLNQEKREEKVIISLTTFGKRIKDVFQAIESMGQQTLKPDEIVLWLSEDHFNEKSLPIILKKLIERGLKVRFKKDIGPYTKLIYALNEYPNDLIITIDDDIIYDMDMIEGLIRAHEKYPNAICCHRSHFITKNKKGKIQPYDNWIQNTSTEKPSLSLMATGVGGVLYFPGCFPNEVFNKSVFLSDAPTVDDLWFKIMSLNNNVPVYNPGFNAEMIPTNCSKINDLAKLNCLNRENDRSLSKLVNRYNIKL